MKSASCKLADGEYAISKEKIITSKRFKAQVGKGENKSFIATLKIAEDLVLPNLKNSQLFRIKYWLHVYIVFQKFWNRPLDMSSDIYLGHLPHNFWLDIQLYGQVYFCIFEYYMEIFEIFNAYLDSDRFKNVIRRSMQRHWMSLGISFWECTNCFNLINIAHFIKFMIDSALLGKRPYRKLPFNMN